MGKERRYEKIPSSDSTENLINSSEEMIAALFSSGKVSGETPPDDSNDSEQLNSTVSQNDSYNEFNNMTKYNDYIKKIDMEDFNDWLKSKNYFEGYSDKPTEDKLVYIEDYFNNGRKKWSFDAGINLGYLDFFGIILDPTNSSDDYTYNLGIPINFCYHFTNSLGQYTDTHSRFSGFNGAGITIASYYKNYFLRCNVSMMSFYNIGFLVNMDIGYSFYF